MLRSGMLFLMAEEHEQEETPPLPDYSADRVDLSLIRWSLSLTPAERRAFLEDRVDEILRIRALHGTEQLGLLSHRIPAERV